MRDWKLVLVGGAAMLLLGCSDSPTVVRAASISAKDATCELDSRGYFVRAGKAYSDSACTVEVPQ
jgi:hypothetical protein